MARTITTIHQEMLDSIAADETLSAKLYSTSKTAIYRLITYIIAVAIYLHETLWDSYLIDVDNSLEARLTHNRQWYVNQAKAFQYGDALNETTGTYDTVDETKQIIAHASVSETAGVLFLKVAKDNADELSALTDTEKGVFTSYMQEVKDAGVRINIITGDGDDLILIVDVFYDPLVLDGDGKLLTDSSQEPAKDAIKTFIKNLPFNGEFIPASLTDAMQAAKGVKIPVILSCQTRYGTNDFEEVDGKMVPEYGYLVIADENLTINYRANV